MKILVVGASGGVGRHVVRLALDQGHEVTALTRQSSGTDSRARLVVDDVLRPGCFEPHVGRHDLVLSSLGLQRRQPANPWSALVSPPDLGEQTAKALVAAMKRHGAPRVIAVSAAGVADSAANMNFLMRFLVRTSNVGVAYRDLARMEEIYSASGLDFCCPRPTRLTHGPLTRRIVVSDCFPVSAAISRADVAWWMLEQAGGPFASRHPTITAG